MNDSENYAENSSSNIIVSMTNDRLMSHKVELDVNLVDERC